MGVWIEIKNMIQLKKRKYVTPFVGVWIEIRLTLFNFSTSQVTPFVGVWIEILSRSYKSKDRISHSLRGSVD